MRTKFRSKAGVLVISILVLLIMVLPLMTACAEKEVGPKPPTPPPTEKKVLWSASIDITGPLSELGAESLKGIVDCVKYINENELAGPGITVEFMWEDSQYKTPIAISTYRRGVERGASAYFSYSSGDKLAISPMCERDKVCLVAFGGGYTGNYPARYNFSKSAPYVANMAAMADYVMANWKEARAPVIGFVAWDNPLGNQVKILVPYLKEKGFKVIEEVQYIPLICTDATTQLMALDKAGVDFIMMCTTPQGTSQVLKDAKRLGLTPRIQILMAGGSYIDATLRLAGDALDGNIIGEYECVPQGDMDKPMVKKMVEYAHKCRGAEYEPGFTYLDGWQVGLVAAEATRLAIEAVGYDNFNGEALKKQGFERISNWNTGLAAPITITSDDHTTTTATRLWTTDKGKYICLTPEWMLPPLVLPPEYRAICTCPNLWHPKGE